MCVYMHRTRGVLGPDPSASAVYVCLCVCVCMYVCVHVCMRFNIYCDGVLVLDTGNFSVLNTTDFKFAATQ